MDLCGVMRLTEGHNRYALIQFKLLKKVHCLSTMEGFKRKGRDLDDDEGPKARRCANAICERELQMGDDALMLQRVVIGVMRPVPLEKPLLFHTDECFQEYVCDSDGPKLPTRIP